ncbi:membrane-spanning 4-domains subfamily A member 4A-like [Salminus brasiliensis]|uniref:membrane-spanning 4-domains subfamily A member 4A-like n=1 Tax=Salminus brasiliensis TaxID=930266 RepID=UPI003B831533
MSAAVPDNDPRNGFMVVTHVIPPTATGQSGAGPAPAVTFPTVSTVGVPNFMGPGVVPGVYLNRVTAPPGKLEKFLKTHPKVVGAVQIMIGIINFLFGIVLTVSTTVVSVYSGIFYWGSVIYIIAGSLTVAAENNLNSCLVKGSLAMNVVSAVITLPAIILLALDAILNEPCYQNYDYYFCINFQSQIAGVCGVLLVLSLLQSVISICISAFACKAICCTEPSVPAVTMPPTHAVCCSIPNPFQTNIGQQDGFYVNSSVNLNNPPNSLPTVSPPAYSPSAVKPDD